MKGKRKKKKKKKAEGKDPNFDPSPKGKLKVSHGPTALGSTTTKTDNRPHPRAQEGGCSPPPPPTQRGKFSPPIPVPRSRSTSRRGRRAGPDQPRSFSTAFRSTGEHELSAGPPPRGPPDPPPRPARSPRRGRSTPHAGSVSCAALPPHPAPGPCAGPAATCPPPPAGEERPRPHGFRCSHGHRRVPVPPAARARSDSRGPALRPPASPPARGEAASAARSPRRSGAPGPAALTPPPPGHRPLAPSSWAPETATSRYPPPGPPAPPG